MFDYFTMCTSNQLYFRIITDDILRDATLSIQNKPIREKMSDSDYDKYLDEFEKQDNKWDWHNIVLTDPHFYNFMKKNKYQYRGMGHEGLIFDNITSKYIFDIYNDNDFINKCTVRNFTMEEMLPIILLDNNYNIEKIYNKSLCERSFSYDGKIAKYSLDEIQNIASHTNNYCSLKPVPRDILDKYRTKIRNEIILHI